ncbi:3-phosphoinositide-dependent protein kinase 2-like [Salvia miltiorrhiza]|uniref:3-phosphoinositide-dependent protein kinase 2-like n=1 Tax=Salvia miltiorrhiza TaxID=226208 RepID=UPI0025ABB649|nr:3-phosphoinositide-dependent protein kinase 2-like [Salvia miltiorrhiza]
MALMEEEGGSVGEMDKEFNSKLKIESNSSSSNNSSSNTPQRSKNFAFRAPQENFSIQDFELEKIYGVGSYSKVVRARKKDTGMVYAMKIMDKKFITKENKTAYVKLERIVLDQLDHPGVVRLYFTFQDSCSLYMGLESCDGGELFDQITRKGRLSEDETRFYAAEVVDALEYIHSMGLIHRDIKPENLLLTTDGHIKIADFGSVKPMQGSQITVLPNAASDDKACTFVGTAAYVPPEVLNSSPATFGNDLWALGCTVYQMLAGISPFKDASEWLIFQRIVARDLRFPDYFSDEARDLIDQLLDMDPSRRPGAGTGGYAILKNHSFFKGIDWTNLRQGTTPPILSLEPRGHSTGEDQDSSWNPSHAGDGSVRTNDGNGGATSSSEAVNVTRLASIDSFDSKWQQFLEPGESVLMISLVKKLQKLTSKKVQLILTNKPQLIYVDPAKLEVRGNVAWSDNPNELNVQVMSPSNFKIFTPKKIFSFEDSKQRATQWKKAIESLQNL